MSTQALKQKIDTLNLSIKTLEAEKKTTAKAMLQMKEQIEVMKGAGREAFELRKELDQLKASSVGTPPNNHEEGIDPFQDYYAKERGALTLGDYTDDQLANAVFLHGNEMPDIRKVIDGTAKMPIVYLTAAKERIRWLSRKLIEVCNERS